MATIFLTHSTNQPLGFTDHSISNPCHNHFHPLSSLVLPTDVVPSNLPPLPFNFLFCPPFPLPSPPHTAPNASDQPPGWVELPLPVKGAMLAAQDPILTNWQFPGRHPDTHGYSPWTPMDSIHWIPTSRRAASKLGSPSSMQIIFHLSNFKYDR